MARRVEVKLEDSPSVYVLVYHDINDPLVFTIHGAFATENKVVKELERLEKFPENKLTRSQKLANTKAKKAKKPIPFRDPMDNYSIREVTVR